MSKIINVGKVTAYADAVAGGYQGTREEWEAALAGIGQEATAALAAKEGAEAAQAAAEMAQGGAETAGSAAAASAQAAAASAADAHTDALAATAAKEGAETAQTLAGQAAAAAAGAAGAASTAQVGAEAAQTAAETAASAAATSAEGAALSEDAAAASATAAAGSAEDAQEVLDSIPEDYSELSGDVADLKSAIFEEQTIPFVAGSINYEKGTNIDTAAQQRYRLRTNGKYDISNGYLAISKGNYYFSICVYSNGGENFVGSVQQDGTIAKASNIKWHQSFFFPDNNDYYYRFVLRIGTSDNIDIDVSDASNFLLIVNDSDLAERQLFYKRIIFNGQGGYIWHGNKEIAEGSTIYFRTVSHATSRGQTGVTLYGLYEASQSGGYDRLAEMVHNGETRIINVTRDYHHLQAAAQPSGGGTGTAAEFKFDILVIPPDESRYGVQSDLAELSQRTTFNRSTCKIFKKVVCCGDSYTSGYIKLNGDADAMRVNEEFAWPHYMATATGNNWVNCGASGTNALTWQSDERGLPAAQASGAAQAYVIGLMINDVSSSSRGIPLGTAEDIGTDAQTYYGGLSKIIRELNTISPLAKIFVNTCPKTDDADYPAYNQAVRDIVDAYKATYPVHLIDLVEYRDLYTYSTLEDDAVNGHYTAIGYEQFAEIYEYVLSRYINQHISDFQDVHKIPYTV